jgi:hypothetical protein
MKYTSYLPTSETYKNYTLEVKKIITTLTQKKNSF